MVRWSLVLLPVLALLATACGPTCRSIAALRADLSRNRPRAAAPHATITVSYAAANALIAGVLPDVPPAPVPVPGPLRLVVGRIDIEPRSVRLAPIGYDRVVATIGLAVRANGMDLLHMTVDAELMPRVVVDADGAWLSIGFGPDNVTSARPRLPPDAAAQLGDGLYKLLPEAVRARVPRVIAMTAATTIVAGLADRTYNVLRATLLARVGEVTSLRVPLPAVPIESVRLRSLTDPAAIVIELHTTLPVRDGVASDGAPQTEGATAVVRVSGSAAAELANWAMATGHAPNRFDRKLRPRTRGAYDVVLDWTGRANRPLKVHVFRSPGSCAYVRVGAQPALTLANGQLAATVTDRRNERVRGSSVVRLGLWVEQLVGHAAAYKRIAASARTRLGPRTVHTTILRVAVAGDDLVVETAVRLVD